MVFFSLSIYRYQYQRHTGRKLKAGMDDPGRESSRHCLLDNFRQLGRVIRVGCVTGTLQALRESFD
jgi:hypothetical protein